MLLPEKEKCIHNVAHGTAADGRPRHPRPAGGSLSSPHRGQNRGTEPRCEQRPPAGPPGPPGLLGVGLKPPHAARLGGPATRGGRPGQSPLSGQGDTQRLHPATQGTTVPTSRGGPRSDAASPPPRAPAAGRAWVRRLRRVCACYTNQRLRASTGRTLILQTKGSPTSTYPSPTSGSEVPVPRAHTAPSSAGRRCPWAGSARASAGWTPPAHGRAVWARRGARLLRGHVH